MAKVHNILRAAIIQEVQKDSNIMALISGRIFPRSIAEFGVDDPQNPVAFPMVTFRIVGGAPATPVTVPFRNNLIVQCWSKNDYDEAWDVSDHFRDVMDHIRIDRDNVQACFEITNIGQEVFDPTQTLYYIVSQYKFTYLG